MRVVCRGVGGDGGGSLSGTIGSTVNKSERDMAHWGAFPGILCICLYCIPSNLGIFVLKLEKS